MDTSPSSTTSDRPRNLSLEWLRRVKQRPLSNFDGCCREVCDGVIQWLGKQWEDYQVLILYIEATEGYIIVPQDQWRYHMVPVINDEVHDAWYPHLILSPLEYAEKAFPRQALEMTIFEKAECPSNLPIKDRRL